MCLAQLFFLLQEANIWEHREEDAREKTSVRILQSEE